ncbi:membrane protein implicated in regulation of membrane protease activity [Leptolyngbya sp. Heron Island J]|uniref:NfeD family protein n=1 Tax=Leptolyngbya sp. Heron Island J TaxID=1385935 RepID=UPI0003B9BBFE|nr:NfeD family protein [Leptolyngbya sp. Heron Island J]ESA34292.1 membrane protein implicated in regulation of membrane protease activity [Leptolyngbya sp. Heron Island J]
MNLAIFWILLGVALCVMELMVPTAFLESALGVSAIAVGLLGMLLPMAFSWQVALWMVLSLLLFWALRRFAPRRQPPALMDSTEARTITSIPPGSSGRVIYEGNSWPACCSDRELAIANNQTVIVVGRQGNTLIVMPESALL